MAYRKAALRDVQCRFLLKEEVWLESSRRNTASQTALTNNRIYSLKHITRTDSNTLYLTERQDIGYKYLSMLYTLFFIVGKPPAIDNIPIEI